MACSFHALMGVSMRKLPLNGFSCCRAGSILLKAQRCDNNQECFLGSSALQHMYLQIVYNSKLIN